jgi:uncharacterized protein Yka (UPF0111/DUF47 family)
MRFSLVPRQAEFYDLFTRAGENALDAARLVEKRFNNIPDATIGQMAVTDLEHKGDDITAEIMGLLARTSTPWPVRSTPSSTTWMTPPS